MKTRIILLFCFIIFCSHNLYIKLDGYFLKPNQEATIQLFNGNFDKSDNVIARDRMLDASLLINGQRMEVDSSLWIDKDNKTLFEFQTGESGTYVMGVSTAARNIEMTAEKFNSYLEHDGIIDMLEYRKANDLMAENAVEKYSKHVKAMFQVGNNKSSDWSTELGYPIEFVPGSNPYDLFTGDSISIKLLRNGKPLPNHLVYVDYRATTHHHHHHDEHHSHDDNHEHDHAADDHDHDHDHDHNHSHDTDNAAHEHDHAGSDKNEHDANHKHSHSHDGKSHTHEHEHENDEKDHDHEHAHDHGDEKGHDHADHEHSHSHDGDTYSHEHKHDGDEDNHDHAHEHKDEDEKSEDGHKHETGEQLRTDSSGIITFKLSHDGIWFLRTIHLELSEEAGLTHESNWATLSFEVTHDHDSHAHSHSHGEDDGIPLYWFIIASVLIIGGLFLFFNKKKKA
ncbi:MAG: DUF4198 domain-containing protein [Bacteroidota bacterium]